MKTYRNLYKHLCSYWNLKWAYQKARKGKTKKDYVLDFEKNLKQNLFQLRFELLTFSYQPQPLKPFVVRDPKTRKICKSDFRDRVVHHTLINILEPIFERIFIDDNYASRKGKGTLKAVQRFDYFKRVVSKNGKKLKGIKDKNYVAGYCLKADIKKYFENINHRILIETVKKKIKDVNVIWLIKTILKNTVLRERERERERREIQERYATWQSNQPVLCQCLS